MRCAVSARHVDVLVALVARAGSVVSKDALVDAAWRDVAVTDNSLEQAISALRRVLGPHAAASPTSRRFRDRDTGSSPRSRRSRRARATTNWTRSSRRIARGSRGAPRSSRWTPAVSPRARAAFERVLQAVRRRSDRRTSGWPTRARCSSKPRAPSRRRTSPRWRWRHATRVKPAGSIPACGEAWATHGFVLDRTGHGRRGAGGAGPGGLARARQLAAPLPAGAGQLGRGAAARRAPHADAAAGPAAGALAGRHGARGTTDLDEAERELTLVCESMRPRSGDDAVKFPGVALEWLLGLDRPVARVEDAALAPFERELALEGRITSTRRECCANAWYAIGAVHLRRGRRDDGARAFRQALDRVPFHPAAFAHRLARRPAIEGSRPRPALAPSTWPSPRRLRARPQVLTPMRWPPWRGRWRAASLAAMAGGCRSSPCLAWPRIRTGGHRCLHSFAAGRLERSCRFSVVGSRSEQRMHLPTTDN